jgi:hypothetical protein
VNLITSIVTGPTIDWQTCGAQREAKTVGTNRAEKPILPVLKGFLSTDGRVAGKLILHTGVTDTIWAILLPPTSRTALILPPPKTFLKNLRTTAL